MLTPKPPLRYQISNLHELPGCLSNNSNNLFITVTDIEDEQYLIGTRVKIEHKKYGALFTYMVDAKGSIVSDVQYYNEMSVSQLLGELERWGFLITYNHPTSKLSDKVVEWLMTVSKMGYDKLRIMSVQDGADVITGNIVYKNYIVVFNVKDLPDWLGINYACTKSEFDEAITSGHAMNLNVIYEQTNHINFSWLAGFVANIDDVLAQNAGVPHNG